MGSPFTTHSSSGIPTPLQDFQHRLDRKSLCWDLRNSTTATRIHIATKHLLLLIILEQNNAHRLATSFPMKLQLQTTTIHAHYGYLLASTLQYLLLSIHLHVKTTLHAKT
jgi:hypothetical protein